MSRYRLVSTYYPLILSASFALTVSIYLNSIIFNKNFLLESCLGWALAFSNKILEMIFKKMVSSQETKEFISSFLFWNLIRLALLVGLILMILASSLIHGQAFIFAFLIAYFTLFVYYIFTLNKNNSNKPA